jgi:hypothetical protein
VSLGTVIKKGVIRDPSVPAGQKAPMWIKCCGLALPVSYPDGPDVMCPTCGTWYMSDGWVRDGQP